MDHSFRICGVLVTCLTLCLAGCDAYFAPLDAELEPETTNNATSGNTSPNATTNNSTPNNVTTMNNVTSNNSTPNNEPSLDWDSASCGGGAACLPGEVCLDGACGTILGMDAGNVATCAVHEQIGTTRVLCWGPANAAVLGDDAGGARSNFIAQAIDSTNEVFHDISVGGLSACVLVSAPLPADTLTVRCWGGGDTGYKESMDEKVFREFSLPLPVVTASPLELSVTDLNYCLSGEINGEMERSGVCWGRFTAPSYISPSTVQTCENGIGDCVLDSDVRPETTRALKTPGKLASSATATCFTDNDGTDDGVRCIGNYPWTNEFQAVGPIDDLQALDIGQTMLCSLVNESLTCVGDATPGQGEFSGNDYTNVRVGHSSSSVCVQTRVADSPVARCRFSTGEPVQVSLLPGHYALSNTTVCGEDVIDGVRQLVCHDLNQASPSWPGFAAELIP